MKKTTCASILVVLNILAALALEAESVTEVSKPTAESHSTSPSVNHEEDLSKSDEIIQRDERSGTDALAIPFDESEVEDEEAINKYEKKDVFNLPEKK